VRRRRGVRQASCANRSLETYPAARSDRTARVPLRRAERRRTERRPPRITRIRRFAPAFCGRCASFLFASLDRSREPRPFGIRPAASAGLVNKPCPARRSTFPNELGPQAVDSTTAGFWRSRRRTGVVTHRPATSRPSTDSVSSRRGLGRDRSTQAGRGRSRRSRNDSASARLATAKVSKPEGR